MEAPMDSSEEGTSKPMPGGPMSPNLGVLSVEDKAFLEEFGTRISRGAFAGVVVGGGIAYSFAKYTGRRRGLWTAFGSTVTPFITWYTILSSEKERVTELAKRLQMAPPPRQQQDGGSGQQTGVEAMTRLFPSQPGALVPPPQPRGLLGGSQLPPAGFGVGLGGVPPSMGGFNTPTPGFRPPPPPESSGWS
eukprot:TRINITY_DN46473_c0_g1_i1.p1 TRINITY_DN46473_c0_g1~~TRINITY_DN46473_c0_g1_i1.p1  ORF type:complete len:191 (+),score=34.60 TRINITY_DN46473_c0_g1_i1:76-648(+)